MSFHRSAVATLTPIASASPADARFRVEWEPAAPGLFPRFRGELFVEPVSTRASLSLRLYGLYTPPLAFLGGGYDHIGNLLAVATANRLLQELRDFVERDVRIERTHKNGGRSASGAYERVRPRRAQSLKAEGPAAV